MKIWFDFTNPPHVNFYLPIIEYLRNRGVECEITARDFVETKGLLEKHNIEFTSFGKHGGKRRLNKVLRLMDREIKLLKNVKGFSISISSNYEAPIAAWIKNKKSIVFDDNDISPNWLYAKFANNVISPTFINRDAMYSMGIKRDQLICYNGFKEDLYIGSFKPDPLFLNSLPFKRFITVRPENIQASYMPSGVKSIVPQLLENLSKVGYNILYLPRYESDRSYVTNLDNVYMPSTPLNGLDVCFHSEAVLTGAGTFSREAALLGKTAVSFYAGDKILSVDKQLFSSGKILHSRNVEEIIEYIGNNKPKTADFTRSKKVQEEVFLILDKILWNTP